VCAQALAHARSGVRIAIASYLGNEPSFDRALADFAETYADLNERDCEVLQQAAADGWITAESGLWTIGIVSATDIVPCTTQGIPSSVQAWTVPTSC